MLVMKLGSVAYQPIEPTRIAMMTRLGPTFSPALTFRPSALRRRKVLRALLPSLRGPRTVQQHFSNDDAKTEAERGWIPRGSSWSARYLALHGFGTTRVDGPPSSKECGAAPKNTSIARRPRHPYGCAARRSHQGRGWTQALGLLRYLGVLLCDGQGPRKSVGAQRDLPPSGRLLPGYGIALVGPTRCNIQESC